MTAIEADPQVAAFGQNIQPDQKSDADVIVIGAGPSGSAAAYWLATAGVDVLLLEKTTFPREKVCGDGLTPRGTRALVDMGIDVSQEAGWLHNKGLRVIGGGMRLELDWPELASFPELRPGATPRGSGSSAGPAGGEGRRPVARTDERDRSDPGCRRPGGRSRGQGQGQTAADLPGPDRAGLRRGLGQVRAEFGFAPQRQTSDGSGRPALLRQSPHQRRLPRVLAGAVGRPARRRRCQAAARLRLDLRDGRRHRQRRARASSTPAPASRRPTTAPC